MKVKVKVSNRSNWYHPDKEYLVLGIDIYLNELTSYVRVYSDINECPALVGFENGIERTGEKATKTRRGRTTSQRNGRKLR